MFILKEDYVTTMFVFAKHVFFINKLPFLIRETLKKNKHKIFLSGSALNGLLK